MTYPPKPPKVISCVVVWRAERFIRPVLDAAMVGTDEVWVAVGLEPHSGAAIAPDRTLEFVRRYPNPSNKLHIIEGVWPSQHVQRNEMLDAIRKTPQPRDTFIAVIDGDEIYDPLALRRCITSGILEGADMVSVPQRVYFKHGNWLVVPEDAHPAADVFMRLDGLSFIDCRSNNMNDWRPGARRIAAPRDLIEVHHMNTVGTLEEIAIKHAHHPHGQLVADAAGAWLERWKAATIDSRNLHQLMPELLPGLRRVHPQELPPHLLEYGHRTLHLDDEAARWAGAGALP